MSNVLLLNPSRWGRGITAIWIASHSAALKSKGHQVKLFDATFYKNWSYNEVQFNTENQQYKPTDYQNYTHYRDDVFWDFQEFVNDFQPDIVFWSALSSHIHGEGEYVNIQNGYDLMCKIKTNALRIAGGLQPTAGPKLMFEKFPTIDYFIAGESELILPEIANRINDKQLLETTHGLILKRNDKTITNPHQKIISDLDIIPPYDYSVFEDQVFFRPYNGKVIRAVDYELSRGCVYACSYCVETVIQGYYGFTETTNTGVLKNAQKYLRHKSSKRIFDEVKHLHEKFGIVLFRCQDTNFLTIDTSTLYELADLFDKDYLPIILYIETRPEGITTSNVKLLKRLHVDGVGMGVEVSAESFRKNDLNRYPSQHRIIDAFRLLREAGIKRTAYNMIGLPNETEEMILDTIKLNSMLDPDNITVAFYSPYIGTTLQKKSSQLGYFEDYESNVDGQLRTVTKATLVDKKLLEFYKRNFTLFVREGLDGLDELKKEQLS